MKYPPGNNPISFAVRALQHLCIIRASLHIYIYTKRLGLYIYTCTSHIRSMSSLKRLAVDEQSAILHLISSYYWFSRTSDIRVIFCYMTIYGMALKEEFLFDTSLREFPFPLSGNSREILQNSLIMDEWVQNLRKLVDPVEFPCSRDKYGWIRDRMRKIRCGYRNKKNIKMCR